MNFSASACLKMNFKSIFATFASFSKQPGWILRSVVSSWRYCNKKNQHFELLFHTCSFVKQVVQEKSKTALSVVCSNEIMIRKLNVIFEP